MAENSSVSVLKLWAAKMRALLEFAILNVQLLNIKKIKYLKKIINRIYYNIPCL